MSDQFEKKQRDMPRNGDGSACSRAKCDALNDAPPRLRELYFRGLEGNVFDRARGSLAINAIEALRTPINTEVENNEDTNDVINKTTHYRAVLRDRNVNTNDLPEATARYNGGTKLLNDYDRAMRVGSYGGVSAIGAWRSARDDFLNSAFGGGYALEGINKASSRIEAVEIGVGLAAEAADAEAHGRPREAAGPGILTGWQRFLALGLNYPMCRVLTTRIGPAS
jgi:hypothetical protein